MEVYRSSLIFSESGGNMNHYLFLILSFFLVTQTSFAKTVRYELTARKHSINLSGKKSVDFAISMNGGIPAPTLEFTEGDEAEVLVKNEVPDEELSVHWHGLLLPPEMDGVPYVNTPPIPPGKSHLFRFKLRQHGTYWYHSHTATQEQKGVYGAFIVQPKKRDIQYEKEAVIVISDWTDENPDQVVRNLRKDGEYYRYKKGTVRSYFGAIEAKGLKNHLANEWSRMGGMDLSDVGYDAFLINGKRDTQLLTAHPGERVRLRIINASASTYFYVSLAGLPMKVISADGTDIEPIQAQEILIGMAETYDVLFQVPGHKNYELRATAQDVTGHASAWIGMGDKDPAPSKTPPDLYASMSMDMEGGHAGHGAMASPGNGSEAHQGHQMPTADVHQGHGVQTMPPMNSKEAQKNLHEGHQMAPPKPTESDKAGAGTENPDHSTDPMPMMDHSGATGKKPPSPNKVKEGTEQAKMFQKLQQSSQAKSASEGPALKSVGTLTVDEIRSPISTELPKNAKVREMKLVLGGDMERYIWYINGKTIAQDYRITIEENEIVRMTFVNDTMMHHPFHLHGHFFRVINAEGAYSPMKHTVDIPPHQSRTIEFYTNEPGDWMLHCHNLYHLKTGMARVVSYAQFKAGAEIQQYQKQDPHLHDHLYKDGRLELSTNHAQADFRVQRTWDALEFRAESREYDPVEEVEGDLFYRYWFSQFFSVFGGGTYFEDFEEDRFRGVVGVSSTLPLLFETNLLVDHKGDLRLDVEKRFQWTRYIFSDAEVTFRQRVSTEFEVTLMYANSWSWDAGLMFTENSVGVGAEYRF